MLRLTDAGRAAMMDGNNRQMNAIQLRSMQIGDGLGPGDEMDDSRTALRSERDSEVVVGTTMVSGRLAVRASYTPADVYSVTEVGLIARIGAGGAEFLFAYFAVPAAADAVATTASGVSLIIAGVIDVTNSAAELNVTVDASITFGGPGTFVELSDVPDVITAARYARGNNTGTAIEWGEAPPVVATEGDLPAVGAAVASSYVVEDYNGEGRPTLALRDGGVWRYLASRGWVAAQIAGIVDSAPEDLNTLREIAAALNNNANLAAALLAAIAGRVVRAGDTMAGALHLHVVADDADDDRAVYASWVMARLAERPMIPQKYLHYSGGSTGIEITGSGSGGNAGAAVALSESIAGFRFIEVYGWWYKSAAESLPLRSIPIPVPDIPRARDENTRFLFEPLTQVGGDARVIPWLANNMELRFQHGQGRGTIYIRAVIGWGGP